MSDIDYFSIVESTHDIQNPSSPAKLREVAEHLEIGAGDQVLDVGSGRGWWAGELAAMGAEVVGLEINDEFVDAARKRADGAGLTDRVRHVAGPALDFEPGTYSVVTCLGASFALGGYRAALEWMVGTLVERGRIAIGDVHSVDGSSTDELPSLIELVHIAEEFGVEVTGLVSASVDDWDRYESGHWKNVHSWVKRNPDHPDRHTVLADSRRFRNDYLTRERGSVGWSILIGELK
ncbi:methyltransferase domain-containing protein [Saccharopolyspora sp. NFXS83]|uniref:SAM-dependent methyltransferase n=1 Tax=Saccharopolyspora sp. NFXS83 TaxID=2993560 RepID=UPI00224AC0D4|nr:class I SAM-dependent methyltransferase [Saccharopolyspora sp. NFXS83]MCX2733144.1 methyltransferase domain-containing protein [Saccharopolyspora sp. NFXS83]